MAVAKLKDTLFILSRFAPMSWMDAPYSTHQNIRITIYQKPIHGVSLIGLEIRKMLKRLRQMCTCLLYTSSLLCTILKDPLLSLLGADSQTYAATDGYMFWTVTLGAAPSILNVVMAYMVRAEGASLHASLGTMSGCLLNLSLIHI